MLGGTISYVVAIGVNVPAQILWLLGIHGSFYDLTHRLDTGTCIMDFLGVGALALAWHHLANQLLKHALECLSLNTPNQRSCMANIKVI